MRRTGYTTATGLSPPLGTTRHSIIVTSEHQPQISDPQLDKTYRRLCTPTRRGPRRYTPRLRV
jgi:hypothetical protein